MEVIAIVLACKEERSIAIRIRQLQQLNLRIWSTSQTTWNIDPRVGDVKELHCARLRTFSDLCAKRMK